MLWKCGGCSTLYAPGLDRCPQCGATDHTEVDSGGQPVGPRFPADEPDQVQPELEPAGQPAAAEPAKTAKAGGKAGA